MSSFFDKLGETITAKSKDVAKKAKEVAEVVNLNAKISTQEEIIKKAYLEIGQKYYEKNKLDISNEFGMEFEKIAEALEEISKLKNEIQSIKNCKVCDKCGSEVEAEAAFCSKCGAQFEVESVAPEATEEEPEVVIEEPEVINIYPNGNEDIEVDIKVETKSESEDKE
jgi:ribosomal protein L40E